MQKESGHHTSKRKSEKPPVVQKEKLDAPAEEMPTVKNFDIVMNSRHILKKARESNSFRHSETIKEAIDEETEILPIDINFSKTQNILNSQKELKRFKINRGSSTLSG